MLTVLCAPGLFVAALPVLACTCTWKRGKVCSPHPSLSFHIGMQKHMKLPDYNLFYDYSEWLWQEWPWLTQTQVTLLSGTKTQTFSLFSKNTLQVSTESAFCFFFIEYLCGGRLDEVNSLVSLAELVMACRRIGKDFNPIQSHLNMRADGGRRNQTLQFRVISDRPTAETLRSW